MLSRIKDSIKTQPRLYDWINTWRPISGEMGQWIARFALRSQPLRFIQIGASDGLRWDPFRRFIIGGNWQGLLVEPLPNVFASLKQNYAYRVKQGLSFLNAALSDTDTNLSFWTYKEDFLFSLGMEEQFRLLRKASFNRDHVVRTLDGYANPLEKIRPIIVPCLTFQSLIREYWPHDELDLVMIDAEGHDDTVIRGMDLATIRPSAILFEIHNLMTTRREALYEWLAERHYHIQQLGGDAVAIRHDSVPASHQKKSRHVDTIGMTLARAETDVL
jgi:FkbM family methyltransferase